MSPLEKGFDPGTKPRAGQANKREKCKPRFFFLKGKKILPPTDSIASSYYSNLRTKLKYSFIWDFLPVRHYWLKS